MRGDDELSLDDRGRIFIALCVCCLLPDIEYKSGSNTHSYPRLRQSTLIPLYHPKRLE